VTPDKPITVAVAVLGSLLCLLLPRRFALIPLALSMCLYPCNMILPPDNLGLTAQRVIAVFLLARCVISPVIRGGFRWGAADYVASGYFLLMFLSQLISQGINQALVNRGGFFLSAMAPFWCVRFLIVDRASFYALLKSLLWAAVPLAIDGIQYQRSGDSPYYRIMQYGPFFNEWSKFVNRRLFMGELVFRAHAPFLQSIMFGWFFAIWIVPATNLFFEKRSVLLWLIPWIALPVGMVSAVAGGPMMLTAFSVGLLVLFPLRRQGWTLLAVGLSLAVLASVVTNRSFMEILANMGMAQDSSWYRVGLQRFVMGGAMAGHWLAGYGEIPGHFTRFHDLCIQWVCLVVFNGLMGLVGYYAMVAVAFWSLYKAAQRTQSLQDHWLLWTLMSTLLAAMIAQLVVALFAEMNYIFHLFLGLYMNAPLLVGTGARARQVGILADVKGRPVLLRYTLAPQQGLAVVPRPGQPPSGA